MPARPSQPLNLSFNPFKIWVRPVGDGRCRWRPNRIDRIDRGDRLSRLAVDVEVMAEHRISVEKEAAFERPAAE